MASPIADLSYRNYDGPLMPPVNRWWAIARMSINLAIKKKGLWVWATLSAIWYIFLFPILFFIDATIPTPAGQKNPILASIIWKNLFLSAFGISQLFLLIIALLIGVGTIANDNRANALLVYLSKPCTKTDYLVGKWLGIFIPIVAISLAPALIFYGYGLMSYRSYGFVSQDPWLFFKVIGMALVPGIVHASLGLGISSLFNQGRLAGAAYAGLYFISLFFTKAMDVINFTSQRHGGSPPSIVTKLFYCSIDGIQIGLAKLILGTDGGPNFAGLNFNPRQFRNPLPVETPPALFIFLLAGIPCALAVGIAWSRVRAVEVVG
jgi:ABC-2 type transport system permease protein